MKSINKTVEEVERLSRLLSIELDRINPDTLSNSESERLANALENSYEFFRDCFEFDGIPEDEDGEDGEEDDG
jgi:coenzyme F420-reducing hydrogenase delta subunit